MTEKNDFKMQVTEEESQGNNVCRKEVEEQRIIIQITDHLRQLGMPSHILGYGYVREAIGLCVVTPEKIHSVTKEIYPDVAKKYKTTSSKVERAMRHAIELAWERGDLDYIDKIFGNTVSGKKGKPTNSQFIAQVADQVRINNQI